MKTNVDAVNVARGTKVCCHAVVPWCAHVKCDTRVGTAVKPCRRVAVWSGVIKGHIGIWANGQRASLLNQIGVWVGSVRENCLLK